MKKVKIDNRGILYDPTDLAGGVVKIFIKIFIEISSAAIPSKYPHRSEVFERILVRMFVKDFYPYDNPKENLD